MEAEVVAANEAAKEAAWLEKLTVDLNEASAPPVLYVDNQGAIDLIHDQKFHTKTKHIDIRLNYIRLDMVANKRLSVQHIPGTDQPADALTKALPVETFRRHIHTMGLRRI
jgi:hypothetical protein